MNWKAVLSLVKAVESSIRAGVIEPHFNTHLTNCKQNIYLQSRYCVRYSEFCATYESNMTSKVVDCNGVLTRQVVNPSINWVRNKPGGAQPAQISIYCGQAQPKSAQKPLPMSLPPIYVYDLISRSSRQLGIYVQVNVMSGPKKFGSIRRISVKRIRIKLILLPARVLHTPAFQTSIH